MDIKEFFNYAMITQQKNRKGKKKNEKEKNVKRKNRMKHSMIIGFYNGVPGLRSTKKRVHKIQEVIYNRSKFVVFLFFSTLRNHSKKKIRILFSEKFD